MLRRPLRMNLEEVDIPEWGRADEADEVRGTPRAAGTVEDSLRRGLQRGILKKFGSYFGFLQNFTTSTATEPNRIEPHTPS